MTHLWAYVVLDEFGVEGVLRRVTPIGTQPMVADSQERLQQFREDAMREAEANEWPRHEVSFERATIKRIQ